MFSNLLRLLQNDPTEEDEVISLRSLSISGNTKDAIIRRDGILILTEKTQLTVAPNLSITKNIWSFEGFFAFTEAVRCLNFSVFSLHSVTSI